jgi:hypothetical protein
VEGTNKAHENGEAMGLVGVRLTAQLGDAAGEPRLLRIVRLAIAREARDPAANRRGWPL